MARNTKLGTVTCMTDWMAGVASRGVFVKNSLMSRWPTGPDGIPTNWTVMDETL